MRAILIDVEKQIIIEVWQDGLEDMQRMVGGRIELGHRFYDGEVERNTLFVDEEGLLKNIVKGFVLIDDAYDVEGGIKFTGNGLICGFDENTGKTLDCTLSIDELANNITFVTYHPY